MSKNKTSVATVEKVFSAEDLSTLENAKKVIFDCQSKADGLAEQIAGQLWLISTKELYIAEGETSMGEYAQKVFGISKGTCSDSIATMARFGLQGELLAQYKDYKFSNLMAMKKLSDAEIERAGINPTMSRTQIKAAIEELKVLEDKESKKPQAVNDLQMMVRMLKSVSGMDDQQVRAEMATVCDTFNNEYAKVKDVSYDEIIAVQDHLIDKINEIAPGTIEEVNEEEEASSTVENEANTIESAGEVTVHAMPTKTFKVEDFVTASDGDKVCLMSKKEILSIIWPEIEKYLKYEQNIEFI